MATVAAVRLTNIISVTQGSNTYEGIRSANISGDKGKIQAILKEGHLYPTGAENLGTPEFPVTTELTFEQDNVNILALLAEAVGSLVIVLKRAGGLSNQTITIVNHQFKSMKNSQNLQDFGKPAVQGMAYSADGTAFPMSAANAA